MVTDIVPFEKCKQIYDQMNSSESIASILRYSDKIDNTKKISLEKKQTTATKCNIGVIGAGAFAKSTLLPALSKTDASLIGISSFNGLNGTLLAKKYNFEYSSSDTQEIINDSNIDTVIITTRHDSHAKLVIDAINASKNVFVEKPLAINKDELSEIEKVYAKSKNQSITVGYNRRFSRHIQSMKKTIDQNHPINIIATMNAGFIPKDHWTQDMLVGGGRIIGEACHYIDLCIFLTGSKVSSVCMNGLGNSPTQSTDNASMLLKFENGSNATINYFSNGAKSYSKERVEVFANESTIIMDNFKTTTGYNCSNFKNIKTSQDKGHQEQFKKFVSQIQNGGEPIISFDDILNGAKASFAALESLKQSKWVKIT